MPYILWWKIADRDAIIKQTNLYLLNKQIGVNYKSYFKDKALQIKMIYVM